MKSLKFLFLGMILMSVAVVGCAKKSTEQASINGTGFDTISSEELAQLPQSSTLSQQAGVEVLPVESSPITQGIPPITGPSSLPSDLLSSSSSVSASGLSHEQQIQTALKNAGLYSGNIDGKIGPASKRALQAFQTAHNLKADGKVGPKTWAALEPFVAGPMESTSTTQNE